MINSWIDTFISWFGSLFTWLANFEIADGVFLLPVLLTAFIVSMLINVVISKGSA